MYNMMTTSPYFDNLKSEIFDAIVPNATLSRLYCALPWKISVCLMMSRYKTYFYHVNPLVLN